MKQRTSKLVSILLALSMLFSLTSGLMLTAGAEGNQVELTLNPDNATVTWKDTTTISGYGYWAITADTADYSVSLQNKNSQYSAVGVYKSATYTLNDMYNDKCFITVKSTSTNVSFTSADITLTIINGVVKVVGTCEGNDGKTYVLDITYRMPTVEITAEATTVQVDNEFVHANQYWLVTAQTEDYFISIRGNANKYATEKEYEWKDLRLNDGNCYVKPTGGNEIPFNYGLCTITNDDGIINVVGSFTTEDEKAYVVNITYNQGKNPATEITFAADEIRQWYDTCSEDGKWGVVAKSNDYAAMIVYEGEVREASGQYDFGDLQPGYNMMYKYYSKFDFTIIPFVSGTCTFDSDGEHMTANATFKGEDGNTYVINISNVVAPVEPIVLDLNADNASCSAEDYTEVGGTWTITVTGTSGAVENYTFNLQSDTSAYFTGHHSWSEMDASGCYITTDTMDALVDGEFDITGYSGKFVLTGLFTGESGNVYSLTIASSNVVELTFTSDNDDVWLDDYISTFGYWSVGAENSTYHVMIGGKCTTSAPGEYAWSDIKRGEVSIEYRDIAFVDGYCTVTENNGVMNVAGRFVGEDGGLYAVDITYGSAEPEETELYLVEITDALTAEWAGDDTILSAADLPNFEAVTADKAKELANGAIPTGDKYVYVIFAFDGDDNTQYNGYYADGTFWDTPSEHFTRGEAYATLGGVRIFYVSNTPAPAEPIVLNLNADNMTIEWEDYTAESEYWRIGAYDEEQLVCLAGHGPQAAGTYDWDALDSTYCYYFQDTETDKFVAGTCTVVVDGETVTITGTFTGESGQVYNITITYASASAEPVEISFNADDADVSLGKGDTYWTFFGMNQEYIVNLAGYYLSGNDAAGTYEWENMYADGCIIACGSEGDMLVDGSCTVEENGEVVTITGTFTGQSGTVYNLNISTGSASAEVIELNLGGENSPVAFQDNTASNGYWSLSTENEEYKFALEDASATQVAGAYDWNGSLTGYVKNYTEDTTYNLVDGSFTIAIVDNLLTLTGQFVDEMSNAYSVTITADLTPAEPAEPIELNFNADNATIIFEDYVETSGIWYLDAESEEYYVLICNNNSTQLAGTYAWSDLSTSCFVRNKTTETAYSFVDGSCTITVENNVMTLTGTFTDEVGNTYNLTISNGSAPAEAVEINLNNDNAFVVFEDYVVMDGSWYLSAESEGYRVYICNNNQATQLAGTYAWSDLNPAGCRVAYGIDEDILVDGSCTIEVNGAVVTLTGTFIGESGTVYNLNISTGSPSVEPVEGQDNIIEITLDMLPENEDPFSVDELNGFAGCSEDEIKAMKFNIEGYCYIIFSAGDPSGYWYAEFDNGVYVITRYQGKSNNGLRDLISGGSAYYYLGSVQAGPVEINLNADNAEVYWGPGNTYWTFYAHNNEYTVNLAGYYISTRTYEWGDMYADGCCIACGLEEDMLVDGSCTVEVNGEVITITGTFTGQSGKVYSVNLSTAGTPAEQGEEVELNFNADNANVILEDYVETNGSWYLCAENEEYYVYLHNADNVAQLAGTYAWSDLANTCYVQDKTTEIYHSLVDGSCTITVENNVMTLTGTFTDEAGNTYNLTITNGSAPAEPVEPVEINLNKDNAEVTVSESDTSWSIGAENDEYAVLVIRTNATQLEGSYSTWDGNSSGGVTNKTTGETYLFMDGSFEVVVDGETVTLTGTFTDKVGNTYNLTITNVSTAANAVIDLIDAIGTVEYTTDCKNKIDAAREAYDALTDAQKALVTNYETLTTAESDYADLEAADAVIALINAIGTVEYTTDCKNKIDAARNAYNALTDAQKALVTIYETLTTAESDYATLKADHEAADVVIALIGAIGQVEYTTESKGKIDAARNAYNALTDTRKALVTNLVVLTAAESAYTTLKADHDAADAVIALIGAIGQVEYTTECKGKIDAARTAYDALTDVQKALVTNYETLTAAESAYATLKADHDDVDAVIALIGAIGTVEYTTDCKGKIDAARTAYDALTDAQKALVTNYETLTAAESAYATLKADHDAASAVDALIDAIGTVTYPDSKGAIDAARNAYNALTDAQKALVSKLGVLTAAEAKYEELRDRAAAAAVIEKIDAIGIVSFTTTSKALIDAARSAYNALTESQKAFVTNYEKLLAAEAEYGQKSEETGKAKLEQEKVTVTTADGSFIPADIELKVEVKTDVKAESGQVDSSKAVVAFIDENDEITAVYDVKLVRTVNGVEEEIQPSDIKEGTVIVVEMAIPEELKGKEFKVLHIHSEEDIEFVEYTIDNGNVYVRIDRLSQFAFVNAKDKGLSTGAVIAIVIASVAVAAGLCFLVFFLLKRRKKEKK